jgi:peptidylglycine monooxygenase
MPLFVSLGETRYRVERPWGEGLGCEGLSVQTPGQNFAAIIGRVSDVACDLEGRLYVLLRRDSAVDDTGPSVLVYGPDGRQQGAWGEDIVDGHMLACGPNGTIGVVDRDAHEVVIFDQSGCRQNALGLRDHPGAPFNHPTDLAFAPNGDVFVSDGYGASCVHRFRGQERIGSWGEPGDQEGQFTTPHAIWILQDGRVAVADRENNRVQVFTQDGVFLQCWRDHYKPMALASDAAGNILITDQIPRLSLVSPSGKLLGRCRPVLNGAHGVTCRSDGAIFLAEINPSRVTKLTPV